MVEIAVLRTSLEANEKALRLQSVEYERRLGELNHSHQLATIDRAQYVTRELHDQLNKELLGKIDEIRESQRQFICHRDFDPVAEQVKLDTQRFGESISSLSTKNATIAAVAAGILALANFLFLAAHSLGIIGR